MPDFPFPATPASDEQPLRRAIGELPSSEPDAASWDVIATRLNGEQAIARALPELPSHEPDEASWDAIAARLGQQPVAAPAPALQWRLRPRRRWSVGLGLAASLLLLLGLGWSWWGRPAATAPQVAVASVPALPSLPALPALPPAPSADPLEADGEEFIEAHCTSLPQVCQSGEFQRLRAQLAALQQQEKVLRRRSQRGATPQLEQQQVQVTIRKATVKRELIHLLIT